MNVTLVDSMGTDLSVVNAARVSFAKVSVWESIPHAGPTPGLLQEQDEKLINYLAKHNHWSPFGHASMQFHIKAPVFVARQLVKHQVGLVWNEVSRRYVDDEVEFYKPEEWRGKPTNSKQGSSDEVIDINPKQRMVDDYERLGGTQIGGISWSNANHRHLLRDYYVASSYNSCCGGNVEKDFVDMIPLRTVIKQGARLLDFEIYNSKPAQGNH